MSNPSPPQPAKPPSIPVPTAALKRFSDELPHDAISKKFFEINKDRVGAFVEKPIRPAHITSLDHRNKKTSIAGINSYDDSPTKVTTFLHLQTAPEFQPALGARSRFGEGDGSFFDRWLNSDIANSKHLYDKDGFPLMKFSLKEVNSGYKRHVSDFKEHKDPNARNFYVKPYAERRAERLAQEKEEADAKAIEEIVIPEEWKAQSMPNSKQGQRVKRLTFDDKIQVASNQKPNNRNSPLRQSPSPTKPKTPTLPLAPLAQQLLPAERENYFGDGARMAFFEYYHHLSRQHNNMEVKSISDGTSAQFPSPRTVSLPPASSRPASKGIPMNEAKLESTNASRPISPAKELPKAESKDIMPPIRVQPKLPDYNAPPAFAEKKSTKPPAEYDESNKTETAIRASVGSRERKGSVVNNKGKPVNFYARKPSKNKEYERQMLLEHLLTFTKDKGGGKTRPDSARTIFLRGCVELGFLPQSSLIIRKDFTTILNLNSLGIGNDIAKLLAEAIDVLPALEGLCIVDNNLTDAGLVPIVSKLANCKNLTLFDLSNNKVDALTADALQKLLTSPECRLAKLLMRNANVDDDEAIRFVESIAAQHTVTELDLSHNLLGSHEFSVNRKHQFTAGEAIGNLLRSPQCTLQKLSLAWNMIRFKSGNGIVQSLQYNSTLTFLDLSYNGLGVEGGEMLGNALHYNKTLEVLKVAHNNLTARATLVIFSGIKSCDSLRDVDLSENPIGEEGAKALLPLNLLYGFRVNVAINNCSIRLKDTTCWFDNNVVFKKEYKLDLSKYYDRAVGHEILRIVAKDPALILSKCVWINTDGTERSFSLASFTDKHFVHTGFSEGPDGNSPFGVAGSPSNPQQLAEFLEEEVNRPPGDEYEEHGMRRSSTAGQDMRSSSSQSLPTRLSMEDLDRIIASEQENAKPFEAVTSRRGAAAQRRAGFTHLSAVGINEEEIRDLFRQTANRIFNQYDIDHSGYLDKEELAVLLEQLGLTGSYGLVDKVLSIYDTDGSGQVEEEEFICFLMDVRKSMEKEGGFLAGGSQEIPANVVFYMYNKDEFRTSDSGKKPPSFQFPDTGQFFLKVENTNKMTNQNTPRNASTPNTGRKAGNNNNKSASSTSNIQLLDNMAAANQMEAYLKAGKAISDASSLFEFALESNKWTINQARSFFKMMIKEYGSPFQVLGKVLPHMASSLDARMLITDVTNHDFQVTQQIKHYLGPLYRVYVGLPNGFYQLWLHEPNDRKAFIRLIGVSQTVCHQRQSMQLGDVSQYGNWQSFRNVLYDHEPLVIPENWLENPTEEVPDKGKIEFDFVSMERISMKDNTPISNLRLFRLLVSLGVVEESKRRRIFNRIQRDEDDGRLASKGYGVRAWELPPNANKQLSEYLEYTLYRSYLAEERKMRPYSLETTKEESSFLDVKKKLKRANTAGLTRQKSAGKNALFAGTDWDPNSPEVLNAAPPMLEDSFGMSSKGPPKLSRGMSGKGLVAETGSVPSTADTSASSSKTGSFQSTELNSVDVYGHHIKEMIGEDILRPTTDLNFLAVRVIDAFETILAGRFLTCAQLALLVERYPGGNIQLNAYATYRVELIISLFSYLVDVINFDNVLKELEPKEMAMCYYRLGWLCVWNPVKPEGCLTMNLTRHEERHVAKILITLNYEETGETWQMMSFQETLGGEYLPDWSLPATWYEESGLPTEGILTLQYYSGKGKQMHDCAPNVNCRMSLMPLVLAQPFEEDLRHNIEHNVESAEQILVKAGIRLSFSAATPIPSFSSASYASASSDIMRADRTMPGITLESIKDEEILFD